MRRPVTVAVVFVAVRARLRGLVARCCSCVLLAVAERRYRRAEAEQSTGPRSHERVLAADRVRLMVRVMRSSLVEAYGVEVADRYLVSVAMPVLGRTAAAVAGMLALVAGASFVPWSPAPLVAFAVGAFAVWATADVSVEQTVDRVWSEPDRGRLLVAAACGFASLPAHAAAAREIAPAVELVLSAERAEVRAIFAALAADEPEVCCGELLDAARRLAV